MTSTIQNGEGVEAPPRISLIMGKAGVRIWVGDDSLRYEYPDDVVHEYVPAASLARDPATADVERGRWTRVQTPPAVGGHYAIGGYVETNGMPRHFERAFANVILTLDGPSWSHCDDRKAHIPIEYWQDLGAHPECAAPSSQLPGISGQLAPSSEPAIAEGEQQPAVCDHDIRWPHPCDDCDAAPPPAGYDPLAQSSTPPASKGVGVYANHLRERAKKFREAAFEQGKKAGPLAMGFEMAADDLAKHFAPTPSNDTLLGRGEVGAAIEAGEVVLEGRGDGTYAEAEDAIRLLAAALQKDTRHDG